MRLIIDQGQCFENQTINRKLRSNFFIPRDVYVKFSFIKTAAIRHMMKKTVIPRHISRRAVQTSERSAF